MKALISLLICILFIAVSCSKSDDFPEENQIQLKSAETRTYQWTQMTPYSTDLICDGELIDYVEGDISTHWRVHYENDHAKWAIISCNGELTSDNGEVLTIKESDKFDVDENWNWVNFTVRFNIKGDKGSHYIGSGYVDFSVTPPILVIEKTVCPPESK
jgi:hypothetical protein